MRETEIVDIVLPAVESVRDNLCYPVFPIITLNIITKLQDFKNVTHPLLQRHSRTLPAV